jgi:hypothetical protein
MKTISAKGGDGRCIENSDQLGLASIVTIRLPDNVAKKLECLNPTIGIVTAANKSTIYVQILPDNHPELEIPCELLDENGSQEDKFYILSTGERITNCMSSKGLRQRRGFAKRCFSPSIHPKLTGDLCQQMLAAA